MGEGLENADKTSRERMILCRKEKNLSLEAVGKAVGVGKTTIRKWEKGETAHLRIDDIVKLAEYYNVDSGWLFGLDVPKEKEGSDHKAIRDDIDHQLLFLSLEDLNKVKSIIETLYGVKI